MTTEPAVQVEEAVRRYGPGRGVCGVSVTLPRGACLALLGRNGSGKSTLTRLVLGLEPLDRGRIRVLGGAPPRGDRRRLARLGVALDRAVHWDNLSGRENAGFVLQAYGWGADRARERVGEWLARAGLLEQAEQPVSTYSLGMRRKLSLVQALAHEPDLLVLDEPTAGVDAQFEAVLTEEIRRRCTAGRSTWVAGNDPEWVAGLGGRVVFLDRGAVVAEGAAAELVAETAPWRSVEITLRQPLCGPSPAVPDGVQSLRVEGRQVEALLAADPQLVPQLLVALAARGAEVTALQVRGGTLRDALLFKTGNR